MNKFNTDQPWWTARDGTRCKILAISEFDGKIVVDTKYGLRTLYANGTRAIDPYNVSSFDLVTHLPDCTGWDWEPIQSSAAAIQRADKEPTQ